MIGDNLTIFSFFSKLLNIDLNQFYSVLLILHPMYNRSKNIVNDMFILTPSMVINRRLKINNGDFI
ncbi:hypothetical protein EMIT091MI3_30258 [Kosakonia quasisacchari]